jgi:hypothetical protein
MLIHTHAHIQTHTRTHMHTLNHSHTHTHTHTHTDTHSQTHTRTRLHFRSNRPGLARYGPTLQRHHHQILRVSRGNGGVPSTRSDFFLSISYFFCLRSFIPPRMLTVTPARHSRSLEISRNSLADSENTQGSCIDTTGPSVTTCRRSDRSFFLLFARKLVFDSALFSLHCAN